MREELLEKNGFSVIKKRLCVPDVGKYFILFVADLHICRTDGKIEAESRKLIKERNRIFSDGNGRTAENFFRILSEITDSVEADAIVMAGDMLDFCSEENLSVLRDGLEKIKTPFMYLRADHDSRPYWLEGVTDEECKARHNTLCDNSEILSLDLGEIRILGINNSTEQFTERGLSELKALLSDKKPTLLVTHVPIATSDGTLEEKSKKADYLGRTLVWGNDNYYNPNQITDEALRFLLSENGPVFGASAGHLHFDFEGDVNGRAKEFVFPASAYGNIGIIEIN